MAEKRGFMKLHYMGKYDLNPDSLPQREHMPNAVKFREPSAKRAALVGNILAIIIYVLLAIPAFFRCYAEIVADEWQILLGALASLLIIFPHELLHAVCFKEDVYLYTNWKQGMVFVIGPEDMSKGRFVFLSLLPNLIFGFLPYILGLIFPNCLFLLSLGCTATSMGAGDYMNAFNALTQMPKGARTYLCGFHSYWYMPQSKN